MLRSARGEVSNDRDRQGKHVRVNEFLETDNVLVSTSAHTSVRRHQNAYDQWRYQEIQASKIWLINEGTGEEEYSQVAHSDAGNGVAQKSENDVSDAAVLRDRVNDEVPEDFEHDLK